MKSRTADIALKVQRTLGLMGGKKSGDGIYVKPAELLQGLPSGNVSAIAAQFKALIASGVLEEGFITVRGGYGSTRQESLGVRVRDDMRDTVRVAARRLLPLS